MFLAVGGMTTGCDRPESSSAEPSSKIIQARTSSLQLTPEQDASRLLQKKKVSAEDLIAFCRKHPNAQQLLYGKSLNLSGRVKNIGVFGLERDRAEITLNTDSGCKIVLECHPERSRGARKGPYYAAKEGHLAYMNEAGEIRIIASIGVTGEARATVRSVTPSAIRLWYTPPG